MSLWKMLDRGSMQVVRTAIRGYQVGLSWLFRGACRFYPSCSQYAMEAVGRYGAARGLWLAACRVLRCHPFSRGGADPVP